MALRSMTAVGLCHLFFPVTANFKIVYVFVAIEVQSRRAVLFNVTPCPAWEWTIRS